MYISTECILAVLQVESTFHRIYTICHLGSTWYIHKSKVVTNLKDNIKLFFDFYFWKVTSDTYNKNFTKGTFFGSSSLINVL